MACAVATTSQLRLLSIQFSSGCVCYVSELVHALLQINLTAEFLDSWQQKTRTFVNNNCYTYIIPFASLFVSDVKTRYGHSNIWDSFLLHSIACVRYHYRYYHRYYNL
ncbi:hypothetical protein VPH35_010097 [Triticum aestivum]